MSKKLTSKQRRRMEKHIRKDLRQVPTNGNHNPNIPDDLVWDEDNPPTVHECSRSNEGHNSFCDETCADIPLTEMEVKLINEKRAWMRAGMVPISFPAGMPNLPGMRTDLLDLEVRMVTLVRYLVDKGIVEEDELNALFAEVFHDRLFSTRTLNEQQVRESRMKRAVRPVEGPGLLGPDGRPLGE